MNRKADDFRISGFTIAVVACVFLCLGRLLRLRSLWLVCCMYLVHFVYVCVCSAVPVLGHLLLHLCLYLLCLCLVHVFYGSSAVCMPGLFALSAFFLPRPLRLYLCLLWLCLICIFCGLSAICAWVIYSICILCALSALSVFASATSISMPTCSSYCVNAVCFYFYFYVVSLNQGYLR